MAGALWQLSSSVMTLTPSVNLANALSISSSISIRSYKTQVSSWRSGSSAFWSAILAP
ncbi:hypothetical protein Q5425_35420 [Amycolatopsis sp. A133]|nr:hypothetical protein [Amycolatopsis sp. A133]MDQ7809048.1 hypothetical protein [Amycolatopsis sp. A133]